MNGWNDITVLAPAGDIDISTAPGLRSRIDTLIALGSPRVIINCENVSFVDSTGIACLVSSARALSRCAGMLSMVNVSSNVMRFLQIGRLTEALHATPSERPAVPVLAPDASPCWSKSLPIVEGVENLSYYRHRIVEMLSTLPMSEGDRFDYALAVGEALSNAYDHADGAHGCTMTVAAYDDRVVTILRDCGCGYEISDDDAPVVSELRGRGIRLMRLLVDNVEVSRRCDCPGTQVRLVKLFRMHGL